MASSRSFYRQLMQNWGILVHDMYCSKLRWSLITERLSSPKNLFSLILLPTQIYLHSHFLSSGQINRTNKTKFQGYSQICWPLWIIFRNWALCTFYFKTKVRLWCFKAVNTELQKNHALCITEDFFTKRISIFHLYSFLQCVNIINKLSQWKDLLQQHSLRCPQTI